MNLIFFYKNSEGELHVALPIIYELKKVNTKLNVFFIFKNRSNYEKIHNSYRNIIDELGSVGIGIRYLIILTLKSIKQKNILMTCTNGHTTSSFFVNRIFLNARMVFFDHAYAFAGAKPEKNLISNDIFYNYYSSSCNQPLLFLNREGDSNYYIQIGFKQENIFISGFPGYSQEWLKILYRQMGSATEYNKQEFTKIVLVTMRDVHAFYLTKENFDYQLEAIFWLAKKLPDYQFILKPHPRQKNLNLIKEKCNSLVNKNVIIRHENVLFLAALSNIVVSYWSSSIVDAIAVGKPVIEFHRHEIYHPQLDKTENNQLVSIYSKLGFCKSYREKEDVFLFLTNNEEWENYFKRIKKNFNQHVLIKTNFAENFLNVKLKEKNHNFSFCYINNIIKLILYKILLKSLKTTIQKFKK